METHLVEAPDAADNDGGLPMRVIVVGAGEVGSSIAASLADEHDVVVIDIDGERVEELTRPRAPSPGRPSRRPTGSTR